MKIAIEKTIDYWFEGAKYDFAVAESIFKAGKYPYALFFGHLAIRGI